MDAEPLVILAAVNIKFYQRQFSMILDDKKTENLYSYYKTKYCADNFFFFILIPQFFNDQIVF